MLELSRKPQNKGLGISQWLSRGLLVCLYLCSGLLPVIAHAQDPEPIVDWHKRQNVEQRLTVLGDDLMGDKVDPATGSVVFSHTDVSIPGNFDLPVQITRKRSMGSNYLDGIDVGFGDWEIITPKISAVTLAQGEWRSGQNRCSGNPSDLFPTVTAGLGSRLYAWDYNNGIQMNAPGAGARELLYVKSKATADAEPNAPEFPANAEFTTADNWYFTCISASDGGQGLLGHAPNGDKYYFDRVAIRQGPNQRYYQIHSTPRVRYNVMLLATKVEDVHGNYVDYSYDNAGKLTRIEASDNRRIDLFYTGGLITSVKSNPGTPDERVWTYQYRDTTYRWPIWQTNFGNLRNNKVLAKVIKPDGLFWEYNLDGMYATPKPQEQCPTYPNTAIVIHPHGAIGTFKIIPRAFRTFANDRTVYGYDDCADPLNEVTNGAPHWLIKKSIIHTYGLERKTIDNAGTQSIWTYSYDEDRDNSDNWVNITTVTDPVGNQTKFKHYFNNQGGTALRRLRGGKLKQKQYLDNSENILRTENFDWISGGEFGWTFPAYTADSPPKDIRVMQSEHIVLQSSDTYTTEHTYNTVQSASDYSYGRPVQTSVYSSVSTTPRVTDTTYEHKTAEWILGLPLTVTTNGRDMATYSYNNYGRKTTETRGGANYATYGYYTGGAYNGLMNWFEDALHRRTTAEKWKRGTPQKIIRPDDNAVYQYVDDNGWLTSTIDAKSYTTSYTRDVMGRLTTYTPPSPWTATTIDYNFTGAITQTISKGDAETIISYDNMFRPTLVETADQSTGLSSFASTEYDAAGRAVFTSFPSASNNPTDGTTTTYDGLGRTVGTSENVLPYVTTSTTYLDQNRTRTTDPLGNQTTTYLDGYAGPGKGDVIHIKQPEDVNTQIYRNPWGQIDRVRQYGTGDGGYKSENHYYNYNPKHQLCRHFTQSGRGVVYAYDDAGQMIAYNRGKGYGILCDTPVGGDLVELGYDDLGRLETTTYAATDTPDIVRSYDLNGNVLTVNRGSGTNAVNWTYAYDSLNNLTNESLFVADIDPAMNKTFPMSYGYDNDGYMTSRMLPSMRELTIENDGLGRLSKVSETAQIYADNIIYHASGSIAAMEYGNGQLFTQSLNARLQPKRLISATATSKALDLFYRYDARGKVESIYNRAIGGDHRTYNYDDLGRLTSATGSWGSSSYKYDVLGNILEKQVGDRTTQMTYNAVNRLTSHVDIDVGVDANGDGEDDDIAGTKRILSYDTHGNVTWLGAQRFRYDMAEQPYYVLGTVIGGYTYDGNLKRVKSDIDGKIIYNVYDASGTLVHVDEVTDNRTTDYIGKIVRVRREGPPNAPIDTPTWLHMDHLGSAQTGSDALGMVSWREQYTPFGTTLTNPLSNNDQAGFTGHIKDSATDLNYMQARYYDPLIGRFLSIDPVGFSVGQPQMFNRFSYTFNDPVNLTDPTGECPWCLGALYGAIAGGVGAYIASDGDFRSVAYGALAGGAIGAINPLAAQAVGSAIGASATSTAVVATTGAALGAVASATGQVAGGVTQGQSVGEAISNIDPGAVIGAAIGGGIAPSLQGVVAARLVSPTPWLGAGTTTAGSVGDSIISSVATGTLAGATELAGDAVTPNSGIINSIPPPTMPPTPPPGCQDCVGQ